MRLLLDTNALLWWWFAMPHLGPRAREVIAEPANDVLVSAASACEMALKQAIGKLDAPADMEQRLVEDAFLPLPVTVRHGIVIRELPLHHRDPFDRILIAQAQTEGLTLVTADRVFAAYDVPLLDARR